MNRILYIGFFVIALIVGEVRGNVYVVTNEISVVTNAAGTLSFDQGRHGRYKVHAVYGPSSLPLNFTGNYQVKWELVDTLVGVQVASFNGYVADAVGGVVVVTGDFSRVDIGTYDSQVWVLLNSQKVHRVAWDTASITNAPSASGGGGSVINITSVYPLITAELTSTGGTIEVTGSGTTNDPYNIEAVGGGGAILSINGIETNRLTINTQPPLLLSTNAGILTLSVSGDGGLVVTPPWTNFQAITFAGYTSQTYVVGSAKTQVYVEVWTASAGFSPGSWSRGFLTVTGSQLLTVFIGEPGRAVTGGVAAGGWGYHHGGTATSTNANVAVSGAGSSAIIVGTNVLEFGGAGGSRVSQSRAPAGGMVGGTPGRAADGGAGTQTNDGAAATSFAGATDGMDGTGGNGGAAGGAFPGSGGGAGARGGGGGVGGNTTVNAGAGGGGSSIASLGQFETTRSAYDSAYPAGTDSLYYTAPWGVATDVITNGALGNYGAIVVVPSP